MNKDLKALLHERRELTHSVQSCLEKVMQMQERIVEIEKELQAPLDVVAGLYAPILQAAESLSEETLETAGRKDIEPIATEILMSQTSPVPTKKLFQLISGKLREQGMCVGGKRPEANMGAHLSHSERIENLTGFGWICIDNPHTHMHRNGPSAPSLVPSNSPRNSSLVVPLAPPQATLIGGNRN